VFSESLAKAASNAPFVFVSNDHTHAVPVAEQNLDNGNIKVHEEGTANVNVTNTTVPVHEQGTVQFGGTTEVALPPTVLQDAATTVDVSPYKEIRLGIQARICPSTVTLATSEGGTNILLDTLTLDCLNGATDADVRDTGNNAPDLCRQQCEGSRLGPGELTPS
jgi:hypothetical protein